MSLVAGLVSFDGRELIKIEAMSHALNHRARGAARIWRSTIAALASDQLSGVQCGDASAPRANSIVIAADARLDNRDYLVGATRSEKSADDAALILAAYLKWGETSPEHLLGDFAFAIWDGPRGHLFCARDHAGVRPFVYALTDTGIVVASEIKSVHAAAGEQQLAAEGIADFLAGLVPDRDATWYPNIRRLPPGHTLLFKRGACRISAYWRPEPIDPVPDKDATERFRATFEEAVRTRLAPATSVFLSGGLDSSSIALTAGRISEQTVPTYSLVFADGETEQPYIDAVLRSGSFAPRLLNADAFDPFVDFRSLLAQQDGLFQAPGLANTNRLYEAAARDGSHVVLDGQGGDEVVSHGLGYIKEQALDGKWGGVWRDSAAEAGIYGVHRGDIFLRYWMHLGPARRAFAAIHRTRNRLSRGMNRARNQIPQQHLRLAPINSSFAQSTRVEERVRALMANLNNYATEAQQHANVLNGTIPSYALETLDRAAAHAGVEPRYPFWDRRLVELCLSLRPEDKIRSGKTRITLREAMRGVLPELIQRRTDKFDFTLSLANTMRRHSAPLIHETLQDPTGQLGTMLNLDVARNAYKRMCARPSNTHGSDVQLIWRSVALATWLANRSNNAAPSASSRKTPARVVSHA